MKVRHVVVAVAALVLSGAASAQSMKPGLWEITQHVTSSGGEMEASRAKMQAQMANMSPEQRKMMQDAMAKHGVGRGPGGADTVKTCMTKEMIDRDVIPTGKRDCKLTKREKTSNTMKFSVVCAKPPATSEGLITYTSSEAYTMKMVINSQMQGGKTQTVNMEGAGKWLGADCGSVRPLGTLPAGASKK
jgi:hypothetical protein